MQEFRKRLRKKVYRTFLLSFLLVFVLPAIALVGFMAHMLGTVEKELETSNQLMLEQMKSGADGQLYSIMHMGDTLVVDDKVLYFSAISDPMDYLNNITAFQTLRSLTQEMTTLQVSNAFIDNGYLFLSRSQKVISNTVMDSKDHYQRRLFEEFSSYEEWMAYVNASRDGFVRRETEALRNPLAYVRTILRGDKPVVTAVLTLREEMLDQYKKLVREKQGMGFTILDSRGSLLYSTLDEVPFTPENRMLSPGGGSFTVNSSQGKLRLSFIRSADTGCVYVTSIPESVYWTRLDAIRQVSILLVALILGVGFFLSFTLAKRQYRPINALRSFVEGNPSGEAQEAGDDFTYLTEMMQSMKSSRLSISQRLKSSNRSMEQYVLESLMWGTYSSIKDVEEQLLALDIAYDSDNFLVAGFCIEGFSDSTLLPGDGEDDAQLMRFVTRNVFSELLAVYNARLIEGNGWIYALLNLPAQGDNWQEKLEEAVSNGRQILHDNFDLDLTIVLSQRVQGLNRVRQAYVWARDALAARQPGIEGLIAAWRKEDGEQPREMLSGELESRARRLEQLAATGDADGAQAELKEFKKAAAQEPGWAVRLQCATLLQGVLQNLSMRFSREETEPLCQRVQQYMEAAPAGDGFGELGRIIAAACKLSSAGSENVRRAEIARQAEAYIQEYYAQSSMSISRVAEHLNLTASYVSALYKRQTGQAMLDTINLTRIRHAKLLLSGSHMSLEQVAEQVGYCDSSSFIRTFKKYEGQTPGQYRATKARAGREIGAQG